MPRTLTISEPLYDRLREATQRHGLERVEDLLEWWGDLEAERVRRRESADRIASLRGRILASVGEMPDSAEFLRDDRGR